MSNLDLLSMTNVNLNTDTNLEASKANPFVALGGLNPLVTAAMPLLLLQISLKDAYVKTDPIDLRRQVIREIATFEASAKGFGCSPRIILAARYCICTALDEIVLLTNWGSNSVWSQQSLLSLIHKETWGGERFFIILEKMSETPKQNILLLELLYIILSLGFEGKYYNQERMVKDEIKHRLFRLIAQYREEPNKNLSSSRKENPSILNSIVPKIAKWKIFSVAASILFVTGLFFNIITYFQSRNTLQQLTDVAQLASKVSLQQSNSILLPKKHKNTHRRKVNFNYYHQENVL